MAQDDVCRAACIVFQGLAAITEQDKGHESVHVGDLPHDAPSRWDGIPGFIRAPIFKYNSADWPEQEMPQRILARFESCDIEILARQKVTELFPASRIAIDKYDSFGHTSGFRIPTAEPPGLLEHAVVENRFRSPLATKVPIRFSKSERLHLAA